MIKVNNKIAANWIKISTNLQSQLIASEEDKIKLSTQIAALTAEIEQLREALAIAATWTAEPGVTIAEIQAALQPKEGE